MKILHCSDFHLDGSKFIPNHLERQCAMIDEVFKIADEHKVKILLMTGDVFNHHVISEEARKLFLQKLLEAEKNYNFFSIYINGNHDIYKEEDSVVSLFKDISKELLEKTIIVDMKPKLLEIGNVSIMAIPFFENLNDKKFYHLIRKGYKNHKGKYYIVMTHILIKGCIRDNETASPSGIIIPDKCLWDYMALGDVHRRQQIGTRAYYAGSPIQHKFGEKRPKGVVLFDTKTHEIKFIEIDTPKIRKLITLTKVPKKWPKNAWVRYKGNEILEDAPKEVIKQSTEVESEEIEEGVQLDNITLGLNEFCGNRGLKKREQKKCVKMVLKYKKRISINNEEE